MTVKAFTNLPGSYFHGDLRTNTARGFIGGSQVHNDNTFFVYDGFSGKSSTVHSNHRDPTPYSREVRSVVRDRPQLRREIGYYDGRVYSDVTYKRFHSGDVPTMFLSPPARLVEELEECRSAAITKARNQLRGESTASNGADLAEARQTANMLATQLRDLILAYKSARKGGWREAAAHLGIIGRKGRPLGEAAAKKHLEVAYGWKPMVSSMYDTAAALHSLASRDSNEIIVRRTGGKFSFKTEDRSNGVIQTWEVEGNAYCGLNARIVSDLHVSLDTLGLMNPFATAWEVVPFSFVFDWFIPIGDMLTSLSATAGLEYSSGYSATRYQATYTRKGYGADIIDPGELIVVQTAFVRYIHNAFPLGGLYGKRNPFSTEHILNALALLRMSN